MKNIIKLYELKTFFLVLSILGYSFRGNVGAIFGIFYLFTNIVDLIKNGKRNNYVSDIKWLIFIIIFAIFGYIFRNINVEPYIIVGYLILANVLLTFDTRMIPKLLDYFKFISIFEACGVYIQILFNNFYNSIIGIFLPNRIVNEIIMRYNNGYLTGFSREVSFTMFLIVIGIGVIIFYDFGKENFKNKKFDIFLLIILLVGLFISGKRATLLFCIFSIFSVLFFSSKNKFKFIKYPFIISLGILTIYLTYPFWSQIKYFERLVELIKFYNAGDIIGFTNGRTVLYDKAISFWKDNKIYGIGWENFKYMTSSNLWYRGYHVHNCFIQILCETGIIGLVFYSFNLIISIISSLIGLEKVIVINEKSYNVSSFFTYVIVFFILYSLSEPVLYEFTDYIIFFISILSISYIKKSKKELKT